MHATIRRYLFFFLVIISLLASLIQVFKIYDLKLLDIQLNLLRNYAPHEISKDVILIGIDEQTYQQFPEPFALWHEHLGNLAIALAKAQILVLGFDISLPDRSYNRWLKGQDQKLLRGLFRLKKTTPVVLGLTVDHNSKTRKIYPPFLSVVGKKGLGYVIWKQDDDRVVRRFEPIVTIKGENYPSLTEMMAKHMGIKKINTGLINYAHGKKITYIPMQDVLKWFQQGNEDKLNATFNNKAVIIGTVLPFEDRHFQPVNLAQWESNNNNFVPGVLIHVQALRNIINDDFIQILSWQWVALFNLCLTFLWWLKLSPSKALIISLFALLSLLSIQTLLLNYLVFFPIILSLLVIILSLQGRQLLEQFFQAQERQRLRKSFSGYVSPEVLKSILSGDLEPGIHGERQRLCVLFSDIRGFTSISEKMKPEEVIQFLNIYLKAMTEAIQDNDGTIDKFMGDGIMAFFGAPKVLQNPAINAFNAAKLKLQKLDEVNQKFSHLKMPNLKIGIGLHIGDAVVGNIGSEKRNEYTAIGDVVNTASRLEGLTKKVGYPIVISADVFQCLPKNIAFDNLGKMSIKGREAVLVYGWPAKK